MKLMDQASPAVTPAAALPAEQRLADGAHALGWRAYAFAVLLHAFLFLALYSACYCFGLTDHAPELSRLLNWDSSIYRLIADNGYPQDAASGVNAFFPLFAYEWHLTAFDALGISIVNAACALVGAGIVGYTLRMSRRQLLLVLAMPTMMFTLVPYAEALFFLFGALLIRGLHRRQLPLVLLGLAGCCLTRAAATSFLPAFLFAELLTWDRHQPAGRQLLRLLAGVAVILGAIGVVMWLQHERSGDAFAFYHVHENWNQKLRVPEFPIGSSAGINTFWLDAAALLTILGSFATCLTLGIRWLGSLRRPANAAPLSKAALFSLGYVLGAGFFGVMYQGGNTVGLSRYIFATPFFGVVLWQALQHQQRHPRFWLVVLAGCVLIAVAGGWPFYMDSFLPAEATWYFLLFTLYCLAFLFSFKADFPWRRELSTGLYVINMVALIYFFDLFLDGVWIN